MRSTTTNTSPPSTATGTEARRAGAIMLLAGSLTMFVGAGLWASTGADLWTAIPEGDMAGYASAAAAATGTAYANVTAWSLGVLLMVLGGAALASTGRGWQAAAARATYAMAGGMALVAFTAIAASIHLSAVGASLDVIEAVGFLGARTDDVATALIVGLAPALLVAAVRDTWAPSWLARFAQVALGVGALSLVVLFVGPSELGFLIIPVGLGWNLAAGTVALRGTAAGG